GSIPDQVLHELAKRGHDGLAVVGIVTEGFKALAESGACREEGPQALAAEVVGDRELYRWTGDNPLIEMAEVSRTHSAISLYKLENLVAINTAIEVDLYGQANVEMLGGAPLSSVGGSLDFAIAANEN